MEKIKLLLYCTKSKPYLYREDDDTFKLENKQLYEDISEYKKYYGLNNSKIVAECDFEVEEIKDAGDEFEWYCYTENLFESELLEKSCLTEEELYGYLENGIGYAIHIKNLNIFDEPRELKECWANTNAWIFSNEQLYVAPQNMRYCGDWNLKKAILISIRPEWLCKILNGEKTIEVRKKVLKEMMPR